LSQELEGIGDRLREERTKAGLSQRELAKRLGLSASLISQLEKGVSKPSVGTLYAIVTELDLSLDGLLRGYEDASPQPSDQRSDDAAPTSPMVHPNERKGIDLASGGSDGRSSHLPQNAVSIFSTLFTRWAAHPHPTSR